MAAFCVLDTQVHVTGRDGNVVEERIVVTLLNENNEYKYCKSVSRVMNKYKKEEEKIVI